MQEKAKLGLVLLLLLTACNYRIQKNKAGAELSLAEGWYVGLSKGIIGPKCIGCHDGSQIGRPNLSTYEGLLATVTPFDPSNSQLYRSVSKQGKGAMPPDNPLSAEEIEFIRVWIASGAPKNFVEKPQDPPVDPPPPLEETLYDKIAKILVLHKCTDCHSDLKIREKVLALIVPGAPESSKLYLAVEIDFMPRIKEGETEAFPLSDDEKNLMIDWINSEKGKTP